jgi:hypothetical protein
VNGVEEDVDGDGLLHVVVGLEPRGVTRAVLQAGDDDDGNAGELGVLALRVTELPPRHDRHHEVEKDHRRPASAAQASQCFEPVARAFDLEPLVLEKARERSEKVGIVLDDQNLRFQATTAGERQRCPLVKITLVKPACKTAALSPLADASMELESSRANPGY